MRLLILSSNNGQGHNTAAMALVEAAEARGAMAVVIDSMLFESPAKSELYEKAHIEGALHAPRLFETGNHLAERMEGAGIRSPEYHATSRHAETALRFIQGNAFDCIAATHIFAAQLLTHLRPALGDAVKTAFIPTDYTYVPFTSETFLSVYFLPHRALLEQYRKSAPGRNYVVSGIPTSRRRLQRMERAEARAALGLPQDVPVALIMTGSMGFGSVQPLAEALLAQSPPETRILILCGRNDALMRALRQAFPDDARVQPLAFTDQIGLYFSAADVLLSKPGGLSSTEAAVAEIPLVHTTPIPGWEEDNVRFFTDAGLSLSGNTPEEMAAAAAHLLRDPDAAAEMRRRQRAEINKEAAADIIRALDD